jgi:hypothetical protein
MKRLVVLFVLLLVGVAAAQPERERVRAELVKTDELLAEVKPIVDGARGDEARQLFKLATSLQQSAWSSFQRRLHGRAGDLTLRARERARQAKVAAGIDPERVREEVRRTRDLMAEFGPAIVKANVPRANQLWKMAQTEQSAAENHLAASRYGYALKFTLAAREHGRTAFAAIRGRVGVERVGRELDRTDGLVEKGKDRLSQTAAGRASEVLNKAVELQRQARQAFADNRPLAALRFTLAARDLLLRAWEAGRAEVTSELLEQALEENDALISDWAEAIRADADKPAAKLLEQGIRQQEAARELLSQRRLRLALAECSRARRLLQRAVELVQTEDAPNGPR